MKQFEVLECVQLEHWGKKNNEKEQQNIFQWMNIRTFAEAINIQEEYIQVFKCFPFVSFW